MGGSKGVDGTGQVEHLTGGHSDAELQQVTGHALSVATVEDEIGGSVAQLGGPAEHASTRGSGEAIRIRTCGHTYNRWSVICDYAVLRSNTAPRYYFAKATNSVVPQGSCTRTLRAWIKSGPVGQQVANELHLVSELGLGGISGGDGDAQLRADEGCDGTVGNGSASYGGLTGL